MKRNPIALLVVGLMVSVTACRETATSPIHTLTTSTATASKDSILGAAVTTTAAVADIGGQTWKVPVDTAITVSAVVTKTDGAVLSIPSLGISVTIPAGAADNPMTISMTALAGDVVALEFEPAGTKFKLPLVVSQDLSLTKWAGAPFDVVYFKKSGDVDEISKRIKWTEIIPATLSGTTATFNVMHFSGYAVAAGRSQDAM